MRRGRQSRISGADHWPEDTTRETSVAAAEGKATSFKRPWLRQWTRSVRIGQSYVGSENGVGGGRRGQPS